MPAVAAQNVRRTVPLSLVTVDPANIATITAREQNVALLGLRVGDAIAAFPAAAVAEGVTVRPSIVGTAGQFSFRLSNPTVGGVDIASAVWVVANLRGLPQQNITIDPASVANITAPSQDVTVPGLRVGDCLLAIPPVGLINDVNFVALRVATADTLPLRGFNPTAAPVDAASQTWRLINLAPLRPELVTIDAANCVAATAANNDITVPGVRVGDCIIAIPPQALEAGVFPQVMLLRAPAADTIRMRFANPTGGDVNPASATWALVNLGGL